MGAPARVQDPLRRPRPQGQVQLVRHAAAAGARPVSTRTSPGFGSAGSTTATAIEQGLDEEP